MNEAKFLNFIKENYQVIKRSELLRIASRFGVPRINMEILAIADGWKLEKLNGYDDNFYHPAVKDKNSMIDMTDFKKLNAVQKEYIDDTGENEINE